MQRSADRILVPLVFTAVGEPERMMARCGLRGRGCIGAPSPRLALLTAVFALPALAQGKFDPHELAEILAGGRHDTAYEIAREHRDRLEGDIEFDFHYGIAALETGHLGEAVFALERVIMQRPAYFRARLELARAHFLRGERGDALEHLEFILAQDPTPAVGASAEAYRQTIRDRGDPAQSTATGYLEVGGGYDSNIAGAPESSSTDSLSGPLEFEPAGGADLFARVGAGIEIRQPLTPDSTLLVSSAVESRPLASRGAFRTRHFDHRLGVAMYGERTRTRVGGQLQSLHIGGDLRQKSSGVSADHAYRVSPATVATAGARIMRLRFPRDPLHDSALTVVSAGATRAWESGMRPTTSVSIFTGEERPLRSGRDARAVADRQIWGMSAAMRIAVRSHWRIMARAQYRRSDYGRSAEPFDRKRREAHYQVHLGLDRESADWRFGPQLRYSRNDANLDPYDYRRTILEMRARYSFR